MATRDPLRDVPASNDTLFIRGFSSRHAVDDIRNFFAREGGRSTVEFFREAPDGILFIALRFESRSAAKEIMNRYHNAEVLGDRITIHWYREMRRAYGGFGDPRYSRDQFSRFDFRERGRGGAYRGRGGNSNFGSRTWNTRSGRDEGREYGGRPARRRRSSSRSRSRTRSPHSGSPQSRSRSSSYDHRSHSKSASSDRQARQRHRSSSEGSSQRPKMKSRSLDGNEKRSMSGSPSSNSNNENGAAQHSKKAKRKKHKAHISNNTQSDGSEQEKGEMESGDTDGSDNDHDNPHDLLDRGLSMQPSQSIDDAKPAARAALRSMVQPAPLVKKSAGMKTMDTDRSEVNDISGFAAVDVVRKVAPVAAPDHSVAEVTKELPLQWKKVKDDKQLYEDMFFEKDLAQADKTRKPLRSAPNEDVLAEMPYSRLIKTATGAGEREQSSPFDEQFFKVPVPVQPPAPVPAPKKRKSIENDQAAATSKVATTLPVQKKKPNNEGGCGLWLPPEKMALVHEKKSEIEKAYKQDCETFATVTKMLISKDPGLEERIQLSLRENLKEIGQRCIQELRDFIEKLRTEHQTEGK